MLTQRTRKSNRGIGLVMIAMKINDIEAQQQDKQPLLAPSNAEDDQMSLVQKAISQTFKSTAHLANLLPTGTVLAFQMLSPIFTNQGHCLPVNRFMTALLVSLCGFSCFILSFSDSFPDSKGKVQYGFATLKGLWVISGTAHFPPEMATRYKIKVIDFVHSFMSILVFAAVALFDQNVVSCFYPIPSDEMKQILICLPVGIGVLCSMLFVAFPTTRHGIGFPISPHD